MTTRETTDKMKDFMAIFSEFKNTEKIIAQGNAGPHDKFRFSKLTDKVNSTWMEIPGRERKIIWEDLIVKGILPGHIREVVAMFEGSIISIAAEKIGI